MEWDGGGTSQVDFLEPCLDFGRVDVGDLVDGGVSGKRGLCGDHGRQGQGCDGRCEELDHGWLCMIMCVVVVVVFFLSGKKKSGCRKSGC